MCGLFGWQIKAGSKFYKDTVFQELLATLLAGLNDNRGGDSWGVWTPDGVTKGWGKAEKYADWFGRYPSAWGHTRKATHGAISMPNAHPFYEKGWWLAHNGVLANHTELNKKYKLDHEVDSMHLLSALANKRPFSEIEGYGAVLFMHKSKQDRTFIGRLTESGDIQVRRMQDDFMFWTSSNWHADKVVEELGFKQEAWFNIKPGKVYYAQNATLYEANDMPSLKLKENKSYDWRNGQQSSTSNTNTGSHNHNNSKKGKKQENNQPAPTFSPPTTTSVIVSKSDKPGNGGTTQSVTDSFRRQWTEDEWAEAWDAHHGIGSHGAGWALPTPPTPPSARTNSKHLHAVPTPPVPSPRPSPVQRDMMSAGTISQTEKAQSLEKKNLYESYKVKGEFHYPAATIAADENGTKLMDMPLGSRARCYCDTSQPIHHKYKVGPLVWKCIFLLQTEGKAFIQNLTPEVDPENPMVKARNFDKLLEAGHSREDLVQLSPAELHFAVKEMMGIS